MEHTNEKRRSFSKLSTVIDLPDLLDIQLKSFNEFLQLDVEPSKRDNKGLQAVFKGIFPIYDSRENFCLDFVEYYIEKPKYDMDECQERGVTYSVPLKAKLRLSVKDEESGTFGETTEQIVYLGNIPAMTTRGTFIINGAERIVVSQLHRSPGVFFDELKHPNGTKLFSARIIPLRGSWVEFLTDISDVMYVYIDRRKKFPVTTLLRAIGYSSDKDILQLFDLIDEVKLADPKVRQFLGRQSINDVVDRETGEILLEKDAELTEEAIERLKKARITTVRLLRAESAYGPEVISNTLRRDTAHSQDEALEVIYRLLRSGEPPDLDTARQFLDRLFFNPKRYDLGEVGRYRLNKKLGLDIPVSTTVLTETDILTIIKYLLDMRNGHRTADDIDHLGNRRIRTVGEQLAQQMSVGLSRMARTIKERMNLRDSEKLTPQDLVNARTIISVINTFFGTSQLSQFMDQTNPLAELTHKRRLSALGPGGLTRERAGFEVRDVHYTHYGRLCPIETPEGPNIGLISSLTTFARINDFGFIETPYRRVKNGRVTNEIEYLSADDEDQYVIAQANAPIDNKGHFISNRVKARIKGEFPVVQPEEVHYMDVSPNQIVSAAAALIPFLEHDDANRALMGSNMQRQAVPLLVPEAPLVGTGFEAKVARDSRAMIISEHDGVVEHVEADKIVIRKDPSPGRGKKTDLETLLNFEESDLVTYRCTKFMRTNQDTCINQRPLVRVGDRVKKGDVLADGCATQGGELALGRNVLVAFMPWRGYNFEDAIVISERVVQKDIYTSLHIEEFELQVRDTKRGEEELTREIPNVSEESTKDLDENGIIRVGAEVVAGDILVGKVTPKGETDPTPEEKLLKAIFGEKAGDVKDASLKAPPGLKGIVIDTKLFSRKKKDAKSKRQEKKKVDEIEEWHTRELNRIKQLRNEKLINLLSGETAATIRDLHGKVVVRASTELTPERLAELDFDKLDRGEGWTEKKRINELVEALFSAYERKVQDTEEEYERRKLKIIVGDELPPGIVQLAKVYVAKKRKLMVGDKMAGRHGNKGVVAKIVPIEDMPYLEDGTPVDIVLNPLGVPSRMNLGQIFETNLGWAAAKLGLKYATPVFDGASEEEVVEEMKRAGIPEDGKVVLYDGRTGEPFNERVTVGQIYMLKLSHLVEDKIHARSIGPYSLITQQPLGGKAQFGGQRFGEMEVWALEAYGAAYTLQEILTVKSDDVRGRSKVYEAIVKGDNLPEPGLPESFNVLIRELQGLGLDVELIDDSGNGKSN
ncbi:MAG: DNA-directed RNA polymerase subunit beta [candidate division KSB1 bacterium]|nr:DNA-directed RNA polymerase subunit beta [candidate division KSB1 bacterium]MDZ7272539.1 DNA-directed RNA polymerase subunit beta [candidate division KSB1 bacterium]MDZ7284437.1 DNA-directed RNA polymerase subunit beta [candidate division KSB1 bacterium]MDZ7297167.1 DNA-directed RNA polymerase subunit beta [candidate division KSB1 bacterium]MDZ7306694.1 DNA-directed RNA polymerase subunit beta [candidate division KSB1 bacterium]